MKTSKGNNNAYRPEGLNVIGEGSKLIGDLVTESALRIDGEIKGNITTATKIVIGKSGSVTGDINCADADIEGRVLGHLTIDNLLSLKTTATIDGEIVASKLYIEEGAQFSGSCKMQNFNSKDSKKTAQKQEDVVY